MDVYRALTATKAHPTAEELHRLVESARPAPHHGTSLATVYNTLEALCDAGLARRIATTQGATRYDADLSNHVHAVREDGSVIDLPGDLAGEVIGTLAEDFAQRVSQRLGGEFTHLTMQFPARLAQVMRPER